MKRITKEILDRFAAVSNEWAIIHKLNEIINGTENDVDIIVTHKDFFKLKEEVKMADLTIIRTKFMPDGISYVLQDESSNENLKLDLIKSPTILMFTFPLKFNPKTDITFSKGHPILSKAKADLIYFVKTKYRQDISHFLGGVFSLKLRLIFFKYIKSIYNNNIVVPGKTVILVGPDGSGKTTVMFELLKLAKSRYFSVEGIHFSEGIFPRLSKFSIQKKVQPDYTKKDSGTFAPIQPTWKSSIYAIYYGIELAIFSRIYTRRKRNLGRLQIYDRYYHDMLFQRSYRKAYYLIIKFFLWLSVKPDLIVFLSGSPNAIRSRKPELSVAEISLQQDLIRNHLVKFWEKRGVECLIVDNAEQNLVDTVREIKNFL